MSYAETKLEMPRVTAGIIDQMATAYRTVAPQSGDWLVEASVVRGYEGAAITQAATRFAELAKKNGLRRLVAIIRSPVVRMGASVVSMSLRAAGSPLEIVVVETREEAIRILSSRKL